MRSAWRGLARGRNLLVGVTIVALVGSAAVLYRIHEGNKPQNIISEGLSETRFSTPIDGAAEAAPVVTLVDVLNLRRAELERDPNAPVLGNPEGDVTVVEFFDYNCPYCKRVADDMQTLIADDPGIRLVYREWPILGRGSLFASRAALAARRQGKYEDLHWALMAQPRVTEKLTLRIARELGLDIPRLLNDMNHRSVSRHIALSMDLSRSLGINGTPSFVIGEQVARGLFPLNQLRDYVREARTAGVTK
jgi:protein-disulfide isomerase